VKGMANEENYTMVFLHDDNTVSDKFACPKCHNNDVDTLEIDEQTGCNTDKVLVTCTECGNKYEV
jgi:DNA-directed RNA polymerase subunit M/transcription elongation factor TFIIS